MKLLKKLGLGLSFVVTTLMLLLANLFINIPTVNAIPLPLPSGCYTLNGSDYIPSSCETPEQQNAVNSGGNFCFVVRVAGGNNAAIVNRQIDCQTGQQTQVNRPASPHPYEAAKIYQAYWAFWHCADQYKNYWEKERKIEDLREGDVFHVNGSGHYRPTFLRETSNGKADCTDGGNTRPLISDMGIDGLEYFTSNTSAGGRIYNPDGTTYRLNESINLSTRMSHLANMVKSATGVDVSLEQSLIAEQYFTIKAHFLTSECVESRNVPPSAGGTPVRLVDPDGTETVENILIKGNSEWVGYGLDGSSASSDARGTRINCARMAEILNSTADRTINAINAWVNSNPDAPIPNEGNSTDTEEDDSCASKGGALGWIACPIATAAGEALGWIEDQMVSLLAIDRDFYTNGSIRSSWMILRNIAFIMLIPMMLVMVIGTALGFEVFSAYTIKTALPRMIIATIFIALSFNMMVFVVDFTQVVGGGIQNIILNPFSIDSNTTLNQVMEQNFATTSANIAGVAGISGILISSVTGVSIVGAISAIAGFLGIAALTLLFIFVLLIFRQAMVVLLLILAPLAILAWIFPGRDRLFNLWFKTFWLMVWFYPVIMVAVAVGKAMATMLLR